jgi:flagellar motor switch protein FliG
MGEPAFEGIAKLDDYALQLILKDVDATTLVMALVGSSPELMACICRNMGNRAALIIREEIELLGSQPARDVENARREIVEIVLELAQSGLIETIE